MRGRRDVAHTSRLGATGRRDFAADRSARGRHCHAPASPLALVAVQTRNELAAIDPAGDRIVARYRVACDHPHGFLVGEPGRVAFVSCEGDARLLALDPGLHRLYVACESGVVSAFDERGQTLVSAGEYRAPHAHSVAVDPATHRVFLPLQDVGGRPVLRIMTPAGVSP